MCVWEKKIYIYIYIYKYARDAKFSETSRLCSIGNVQNCVFAMAAAMVICTFLNTVYLLHNVMFDGRFLFGLKYKMHSSLMPLTWNSSFSLFVFLRFLF